jgi:hypothetical protein
MAIEQHVDPATLDGIKQAEACERDRLKLATSRMRVRSPGRPSNVTVEEQQRIRAFHRDHPTTSHRRLADTFGTSKSAIGRILRSTETTKSGGTAQ